MQKMILTAGPYVAASANNISLSQTGAPNALVLNGSTAGILDQPRRVLFTNSGDNSAVSFLVTGTTWGNSIVSETVAGNASTAYTNTDFLTVTSIGIVGASSAPNALTVGTNTVAGTAWARLDGWANAASVNIQTTVSGTINYTIQCTMDDPNSSRGLGNNITGPNGGTPTITIPNVTWDSTLPAVESVGVGISLNMAYTPVYVRALINSWTTTGSMTMNVMQQGVVSA